MEEVGEHGGAVALPFEQAAAPGGWFLLPEAGGAAPGPVPVTVPLPVSVPVSVPVPASVPVSVPVPPPPPPPPQRVPSPALYLGGIPSREASPALPLGGGGPAFLPPFKPTLREALSQCGLERHYERFVDAEVDCDTLLLMTFDDLQEFRCLTDDERLGLLGWAAGRRGGAGAGVAMGEMGDDQHGYGDVDSMAFLGL